MLAAFRHTRTSAVKRVMGLHCRVGLSGASGRLAWKLLVSCRSRVRGLLRRGRGINRRLESRARGGHPRVVRLIRLGKARMGQVGSRSNVGRVLVRGISRTHH